MIRFTALRENVTPPKLAQHNSSGFDFYSPTRVVIQPNQAAWIDSGIAVGIPEGHVGQFHSRIGLASQQGLLCIGGIIDPAFNKEVRLGLLNISDTPIEIKANEAVAQLIVTPCNTYESVETKTFIAKPVEARKWSELTNQPKLSGKVLCVPTKAYYKGLRSEPRIAYVRRNTSCYSLQNYQFMADSAYSYLRTDAETDRSALQLLPYVMIKKGNSFLSYKRGKGGEARLGGLRSIGFGGHIDEGIDYLDKYLKQDSLLAIFQRTANRELAEEIGNLKVNGLLPIGVLNTAEFSTDADVGWFHLGLLYVVEVPEDFVPKTSEANIIKDVKWMTIEELMKQNLEAWSDAGLRYWRHLNA